MLNFLRVSVSALALSAFVVAPVATVVSADYAYAKNGNGGGKGGGKPEMARGAGRDTEKVADLLVAAEKLLGSA